MQEVKVTQQKRWLQHLDREKTTLSTSWIWNCKQHFKLDLFCVFKIMPRLKSTWKFFFYLLFRYLELGMELTSINRVMEFTQERIAGDFIQKTTERRSKAITKVQKKLFKLINVSEYLSFDRQYLMLFIVFFYTITFKISFSEYSFWKKYSEFEGPH